MAHDGCKEVEWVGKPFSYLLHHPGFLKTENYGGKGVWSGRVFCVRGRRARRPAPRALPRAH